MPTFLLLLLGLAAGWVRALGSSREGVPAVVALPLKNEGAGVGDPCVEGHCGPGTHTICNNKTKTCMCDSYHPVTISSQLCAKGALLGAPCFHHDQCQYYDVNSLCQEGSSSKCQCQDKFELRSIEGLSIPKVCFPDLESLKADVPTLLGLGLALSMLSALICLVLKIFARARFARPRRYADARINPPLTVSETYAAFALAANASSSSSPARGRQPSIRSTKSASSSRRPSYSSLHSVRPGGSRRPSQSSMASSSGDLREGRMHHYLYLRAPNYSLTSETNTTTTGTSDSSPRTPKSAEQLLAVYSVPEHSVLELGGVGSSHTTSTLGSSSDDVFKEEDEDEEEEEEERQQRGEEEEEEEEEGEGPQQQQQEEEAKARLIV
ncbi:histone H3.v1-like isoform X3 [Eriocheir sinensis]|uniref:histone H3.v1-like isoform X3 n=1 Tax=Eriocheir sinensis TaxID=95602 RepID=UPI0021CAB4B0|nr:histone H3.v1-like isoform X3 [Eriocheir sinensis]